MKKILSIMILAGALAFIAGCEKEPAPELKEPKLTITTQAGAVIAAEGGEFVLEYTIENTVEDGKIIANTDAVWVTLDNASDCKASFTVAANDQTEDRKAVLTITYKYGDKTMTDNYSLTQTANEIPEVTYDYNVELKGGYGWFFGTQDSRNGEYDYRLILCDRVDETTGFIGRDGGTGIPSATYYYFDFWSDENTGAASDYDYREMSIPTGTYTFNSVPEATDTGTFSVDHSLFYKFIDDPDNMDFEIPYTYFSDGEIEVSLENGIYTIKATLTDQSGKTHNVSYKGELYLHYDLRGTNLFSDKEVNLSECSKVLANIILDYQLDNVPQNVDCWQLQIYPDDAIGEGIFLDINTEMGPGTYMPEGEYPIHNVPDVYVAGTVMPGSVWSAEMFREFPWGVPSGMPGNSWYREIYLGYGYQYPTQEMAPLVGGTITIVDNDNDTYTIKVDCIDDATNPNSITAEWTGEIYNLYGTKILSKVNAQSEEEDSGVAQNTNISVRSETKSKFI